MCAWYSIWFGSLYVVSCFIFDGGFGWTSFSLFLALYIVIQNSKWRKSMLKVFKWRFMKQVKTFLLLPYYNYNFLLLWQRVQWSLFIFYSVVVFSVSLELNILLPFLNWNLNVIVYLYSLNGRAMDDSNQLYVYSKLSI